MNAPDLADVLAEVNRWRGEREMAPLDAMPKGEWESEDICATCPLARALGVMVGTDAWWDDETADRHELPPVLARFRDAFDDGLYPELKA